MDQLRLSLEIYSPTLIRTVCGIYSDYARIRVDHIAGYVILTFEDSKYDVSITMKEFENYLINLQNA